MNDTLAPLKAQWKMEHRILSREKWRIERRIKELEEMLESFFGVTDGLSPLRDRAVFHRLDQRLQSLSQKESS